MNLKTIIVVLTLITAAAAQDDQFVDREKIREVRWIFVTGNNPGAQTMRAMLRNEPECLLPAAKASEAEGVLDVAVSGRDDENVSATLTNRAGELIWSHSLEAGTPDFSARLLMYELQKHACSTPKEKKPKKKSGGDQ